MFGINWRWTAARRLLAFLTVAALVLSLAGCGDRISELPKSIRDRESAAIKTQKIKEVSPPETLQQLRQTLDSYQPQVKILRPRPDEVLEDNTVTVKLQVQDLPIFKDANLGLGPHLQVFLDNQPDKAIYDANQPLVLSDLEPGTHTLRVFAARPWGESFKNEGAYAQTTFHLFTKTQDNNPNPALPLLTYSRPQGSYGTEPIMLDFYLTNAPLHSVAQENPQDEIVDWKIRVTVNGESFVTDAWQPVYLEGFKRGKNWVQLEFLDEQGNVVTNAFNNTVRLITYELNGQDPLSKLVRGELTAADARGIVDPKFTAKTVTPTPKPVATPTPEPVTTPTPELTPEPVTTPTPQLAPEPIKTPTPKLAPEPIATPTPQPVVAPTPKPASEPVATPTPETISEPVVAPSPKTVPIVEATPTPQPTPALVKTPKPELSQPILAPKVEPVKEVPPAPVALPQAEKWNFGEFFGRFLRPEPDVTTPSPTLPPKLPEIVDRAPIPEARSHLEPGESPQLVPVPLPVVPKAIAPPTEPLTVPEQTVSEPEVSPEPQKAIAPES